MTLAWQHMQAVMEIQPDFTIDAIIDEMQPSQYRRYLLIV